MASYGYKDYKGLAEEKRDTRKCLYMRSTGVKASKYEWTNPEEADGVPVLARKKVSDSDPNVRVAYDNFSLIMNTKSGYMSSNVKRSFGESVPEPVQGAYRAFDQLNNTSCLWKDLTAHVAGWGATYTLCKVDDKNPSTPRIIELNGWQCYVKYDENGTPYEGVVYQGSGNDAETWVYDAENIRKYKTKVQNENEEPYETVKHGFMVMPIVEWLNNSQARGNAQKAVTLMDAYDSMTSDNVTEASALRSAYIILKNAGIIDDETKESMKKTGIFSLSGDADAQYLQKNVNPAHIELMLDKVWSGIWTVSSSVDPEAMSTLSNATAFQIGQLYRLMETDCMQTEQEFQKSLEFLDRILKSYWTGLATPQLSDYNTYDVNYEFMRTVPQDVLADLEAMNRAGVRIPQYVLIMRALGVSEEIAREYAQEASEEMIDALPVIGE